VAQQLDLSDLGPVETTPSGSGLAPLATLWRRKGIIVCLMLLSLGLGYFYYLQATRVYLSEAQVLLIKREANLSEQASQSKTRGYGYEDTLSTHMILICSPKIVEMAIEKGRRKDADNGNQVAAGSAGQDSDKKGKQNAVPKGNEVAAGTGGQDSGERQKLSVVEEGGQNATASGGQDSAEQGKRRPDQKGRQKDDEPVNLLQLPSLAGSDDRRAATIIMGGLKASRAGDKERDRVLDPNVIRLSYEGLVAEDCPKILTAVIASYQDFLKSEYENYSDETVELISVAKDDLSAKLQKAEEAYSKFREEKASLLWKRNDGANLPEGRMSDIESARAGVLVEAAQTQARLKAIETALKTGGSREALSLLVARTEAQKNSASGARVTPFEDKVFNLLLDEQDLLEAYGPDHPKVKGVRKKMNLIRDHLGNTGVAEDAPGGDFLSVYLDGLRQEGLVQETRLEELTQLFEKEKADAQKLARVSFDNETLRGEIERIKQLFQVVVRRLEEINLAKNIGGISTQVIFQPSPAGLVKPRLTSVAAAALLIGLVLGIGMAFLIDLADRSFRNPEDVRRQLGLPIVGHIPVLVARKRKSRVAGADALGTALHPLLCTYHLPKSRQSEAYRGVRTALYFGGGNEGHQVIQITSPHAGDGKTTLAGNLAIAIADSGKKVALLDADFRRPRVHKLFGLENTAGLSSLILGETEIPDAIRSTCVTNLTVITSGTPPKNPSDLLTSPRFKELLDVLKEQYDFVVIDSPPVLAVTDPTVIAPRVDGVLLVMRLSKHARDAAVRAVEALSGVGVRILGIVINGVGAPSRYGLRGYRYARGYRGYGYGGYHYGGYGYGSKYGSGYGYYDGYRSRGGGDYYSDGARTEGANGDGREKTATGKAGEERGGGP